MKALAVFIFLFTSSLQAEEIYLLPTTIGDRTFNDLLVIEPAGMDQGSLTVPGVFSAPIFNMRVKIYWHGTYYTFSIKAVEGGSETLVKYEIFLPNTSDQQISGSLKLEDGTVLGNIKGGVRLEKRE